MTGLHDLLDELADLAPTTLEREVVDRRSPWGLVAAAAAVVLVTGGAVAVLDQPGDHRATVVEQPTATPTGPPTKEQAEQECRAQIPRVVPPPGAVEQSTPPGQYLTTPPITSSGDYANESRFWTSTLSLDDALAYVRDHQPADVSSFGGSGENTQNGVLHSKELLEGLYGQAQVSVTFEPLSDGTTGIRADAICTYGNRFVSSSGGIGQVSPGGVNQGPTGDSAGTTGDTVGTTGG